MGEQGASFWKLMAVRQGGLVFVGFVRLLDLELNCLETVPQTVQNIYGVFSLNFLFPSFFGRPKDWERWHRAVCKGGSRCQAVGSRWDPA